MKSTRPKIVLSSGAGLLLSGLLASSLANCSAELLNDREIAVHTRFQIDQCRQSLIRYLWGSQGFPEHRLPDIVLTNVACPVKQLDDLHRVDELRMDLAPGLQGLAYHFLPRHPNRQLVVLHHGHGCTLDDDPSSQDVGFGLQRTIRALLHEGYGVLGVFMPHMRPGDCTGEHDAMFVSQTTGSPLKYFLEPTAIGLNYLKSKAAERADHFPQYKRFHMAGLSGGGWTTTVYAAIDPTIQYSFPIAGTIPLYLRSGGSIGDREQSEPAFYGLAGYPDLYILGAAGVGRKQVQILLRRDDCCFGEAQHDAQRIGKSYEAALREYESRVRDVLKAFGEGSFCLEIDEEAPSHMISHHAIQDILLRELQGTKIQSREIQRK